MRRRGVGYSALKIKEKNAMVRVVPPFRTYVLMGVKEAQGNQYSTVSFVSPLVVSFDVCL